ncbi:hypothetical protein D3C85_630800 [compost metagenome]
MSRYFMIQSWVGSNENEPDYNGQQCGERNVRSTEAVPLYDQYGNANVSAFSDEAIVARKANPKKHVPLEYKITPAVRTIDRLEAIKAELEGELEDGKRDFESYKELSDALEIKLERAWKNYYRQLGKQQPESPEAEQYEEELEFSISSDVSIKNNSWNDVKFFLAASVAGAMLLLTLSHL